MRLVEIQLMPVSNLPLVTDGYFHDTINVMHL